MSNKYLHKLKTLISEHFNKGEATIILFGSRARRENSKHSDVDVGILTSGKPDDSKITLLKEAIEDSNIPYKVDIISINEASEDFKNEIMKDAIVWNE